MSGPLEALIADLQAAANGAPQAAAAAIGQGNAEARMGVSVHGLPGPALQTILAQASGTATGHVQQVDPNLPPRIAAHMASTMAAKATQPLRGK